MGLTALVSGFAQPAAAHMNYDENPAASACCGGADCGPVEREAILWDDEKKGWHVEWGGDVVFVPRETALPSPDRDFHGCGNQARGLFGAKGPLPPGAAAELEPWRICFLVPDAEMRQAYADLDAEGQSTFGKVLSGLLQTGARRPLASAPDVLAHWAGSRTAGSSDPTVRAPLDQRLDPDLHSRNRPSVEVAVPLPGPAWLLLSAVLALGVRRARG